MAAHAGRLAHPFAIGPDGPLCQMMRVMRGKAAFTGGDNDAGGQPLDIPLERPVQRLVKVVDVEDERAFRRREQSEVRQMGITAQLDDQSAGGGRAQVSCHRQGRAAEVGERRSGHSAVANRHQVGHPRSRLAEQQLDRIGPGGCRPPCGLGFEGGALAGGKAGGPSLLARWRGQHHCHFTFLNAPYLPQATRKCHLPRSTCRHPLGMTPAGGLMGDCSRPSLVRCGLK